MIIVTQTDLYERRLKTCVDAWPGCYSGGYDPHCCRFPKSCSPHGYIEAVDAGNITDNDLEPRQGDLMQIIFESPFRITCDCGWYYDTDLAMTDGQAREIAQQHIISIHTHPDREVEMLAKVPEFADEATLEIPLYSELDIREIALTQAVTSLYNQMPTREILERRTRLFETYLRTGEFSQ